MVGSFLGFVLGSAASAHVGGQGWLTDTKHAVLLGGPHLPPSFFATVGNEMGSNSNRKLDLGLKAAPKH